MYDDKIVILRGADRVRKRPAVVFGSDDCSGAFYCFKMLLNFLAVEPMCGHSKGITVTLFEDNAIGLYSPDRGLIIDNTLVNGKPDWYYDFCELYARPINENCDLTEDNEKKHADYYGESEKTVSDFYEEGFLGFNLCCVQYASEYADVYSVRDGNKKTLHFKKGNPDGELISEITDENNGTYFKFKPDSEVFSDVNIPREWFEEILLEKALTIPGARFELVDCKNAYNKNFYYENGISDYVKERIAFEMPIFDKSLEAVGKDRYNRKEYSAKVRVVFGFATDKTDVKCFHNSRELKNGGTHLEKVKENILEQLDDLFFDEFYEDEKLSFGESWALKEKNKLLFEEIKQNLILIIETESSLTSYTNALKNAIDNVMIRDMASDVIRNELGYYLKQNSEYVNLILKGIFDKRSNG